MRGAGCIINDIWDRNLDNAVERTKDRPLASGKINLKQAMVFLFILLACGAAILLSLNQSAIVIGLCSIPLIIAYPLMKRITYWPQAFLGITFNFGALIGWAAITGTLGWPAILLYIGGIFWTIGYDTIYAHQDKDDDLSVGIKSTALKFGPESKKWLIGFYALAFLCLATAILSVNATILVILGLLAPFLHLIWQIYSWDIDNQDNSLQKFKSNRNFGLFILLCCLI